MTESDYPRVSRLFESFDVTTLGEGDPVAGANTLAAMACSIANISRPGSCLVNKEGVKLGAGASLLISGSLSATLAGEKIISGLGTRQNNLLAHQRDLQIDMARQSAKPPILRQYDPDDILARGCSPALLDLDRAVALSRYAEEWMCADLVKPPGGLGRHDLFKRPLAFINAAKPSELKNSMEHIHLAQALVHIGLTNPAACTRFDECCTALMNGGMNGGALSETVRGHVLSTSASLC